MLKLSRLPSGEPEIFASIQGEGVTCGCPSVFVRLALCNLACTWCDTKYTWDWAAYDIKTLVMGMEPIEVLRRVIGAATPFPSDRPAGAGREREQTRAPEPAPVVTNVVITGGEPLLQQGALVQLARQLKERSLRIEVETNATIAPSEELGTLVDQWNVSPKLSSSGNVLEQREVAEALRWFARNPAAFFKFVVVGPDDLAEIATLAERYGLGRDRILLMPEGTERQVLEERSQWLVKRCLELGYRFSPRLHIMLWGDERGR